MANYSATEIKAFKLKDKMNCRMSALKAAATTHQGLADVNNFVEVIKSEADKYYSWLRQDQDDAVGGTQPPKDLEDKVLTEEMPRDRQLPVPTLQQKKVLDAICEKVPTHAEHVIHGAVLKWAEAAHGQQSYPTKLESVEIFLKWYKTY